MSPIGATLSEMRNRIRDFSLDLEVENHHFFQEYAGLPLVEIRVPERIDKPQTSRVRSGGRFQHVKGPWHVNGLNLIADFVLQAYTH
ncbi:MAG: hypothetical protein QOE71_3603 [Pseudonocardiales bacterium]|jgi:hypothetical protein|nr:hypothetical protein [Pseudonocardiales bacterium]MDX6246078.1 hypothetical protein [Frankiales bacterium]